MHAILAVLAAIALLSSPAAAQCVGINLIEALPAADRAALGARADATPFAQGNYWRATRDGQEVTLLGTYHLDDPRHDALVTAIRARLDAAAVLLVEAGPEEEAALMARMARDPGVVLAPEGPTLAETLPPEEWQQLAQAMRDRGVPPFMASRFRPWYVTMLLSIPPCAMEMMTARNGLDQRLIAQATADGIPVRALEPYDTALKLFDGMDAEAQRALIRSTLLVEDQAADLMATLTATYFAEESRLIWEFQRLLSADLPGTTPEEVDADFAAMEEALMNARNRAWLPVIEAAAAEGPVFAGFGALHLAGEQGVLNLMSQNGWALERLALR